ncbi:GNAT family N-acetyltransferase [Hydrogenophaga sp.]|uniref:GNAT family N-acetyltransferase n=1 Tax=Hydrogenophaga sp. TaxID=1904254 RepID=UPI003562D9B9
MDRHGTTEDVFETEAWFQNLVEHGFEQDPGHLVLALNQSSEAHAASLHLMRTPTGLTALSNYYSSLYGAVGLGEAGAVVDWHGLAQRMRRLPGSAIVRLQPLDEQGVFLRGMAQGLQAAGYWVGRYFCFGNWYLPVAPGGFATYWADRPPALKNAVARGRRRLDRQGAWRTHIYSAGSPDLDQAIGAYQTVYAQSWKQLEPCPGFMPGLIRTAAAQGWLRLGVLWLDDQPIAAQVWLLHKGKANIYKLAYSEGQERYSPGSVLTADLMAHVMDTDGATQVDYLTGDDAYKQDWMSHRRERVGLVAFDPRRLLGLLGAARHFGGRLLKNRTVRAGLPR